MPAAAAAYDQPSSKRITTDSVLDSVLSQVSTTALSRQHSAAGYEARTPHGSNIADDMHDARLGSDVVQQPSTSRPLQSSTNTSRRNSFIKADSAAAAVTEPADEAQPRNDLRATADSVLEGVLRQVEDDADRASVDSLLDGVVEQVAGAASQQRTTADSVLDAMLDDVASSQTDADAHASRLSRSDPQEDHMLQPNTQAVSHLLTECCSHGSSCTPLTPPFITVRLGFY